MEQLLHSLFSNLGYRSYHGVEWRGCDNLALLRTYECFSDDIPRDLPKLDKLFPGSKYILQVRDLNGWIHSRLAHIAREKEQNIVGGPEWNLTEYAITNWITKRNAYHLMVLNYFSKRPSDLLVVNFVSDYLAANKVANFLGFEGEYSKPNENANPSKTRPARHTELLQNVLEQLAIPEIETGYDIYCPSLANSEEQAKFPVDSSFL